MLVRSVVDWGALVQERRKRLGWSQSELGSKMGVRRLWVSQFESGKATVQIGLVMRALRALGLEVEVREGPATDSGAPASDGVDLDVLLAEHLRRGMAPRPRARA